MKFKSTALQEEARLNLRPSKWLCSSFMSWAQLARATVSHYTLTFYFINHSNSRFFLTLHLLFHLTCWFRSDSPVYVSTFVSLAKTLFGNFLQPYSSVNHIRYSYAYLQQQYTRGTILLLSTAVVCLSLKHALLSILVEVAF